VSNDGSPEQIVVSAPRPNSTSSKTGPGIGAALSATAVTGEGAFGPESLLPALPTAGEVLGGLAALVTSPVTIAAAILGGVLFPNSTAADDTLDGRTFTSTPPPPNVLPGGPPVALPPPAPFPAPAQQDQGAIIRPGGGPVPSLPPLTFPAQEGQGPQIRSGNTVPVQLPNVVFNDAADNPFGVPPSIVRLPPERPSGLDERHEGGGQSDPPTGDSSISNGGFGSEAQFLDHYARHSSDLEAPTPDEYAQQAGGFLKGNARPGTLETIRPNGDIVRYNPTTNEFGVVKADGTIRTYYKPDPAVHGYPTNLDYFNAQ
jgi:hypothetical protein